MNVLIKPFAGILDYSGRSSRTEYFLFYLTFFALILTAATVIDTIGGADATATENALSNVVGVLVALGSVLFLLSWLPLNIRRLHDQGQSAIWLLGMFVPMIGWILLLYMMSQPGSMGENDYGVDPRGSDETEVFD